MYETNSLCVTLFLLGRYLNQFYLANYPVMSCLEKNK